MNDDYEPSQTTWPATAAPTSAASGSSLAPAEAPAPVAPGEVAPAVPVRPARVSHRVPVWTSGGGRLRELVWLVVGVVNAFLAVDFLLRALGVAGDQFVSTVERVGSTLHSPFAGIFSSSTVRLGHTNDWALLLALVLYTIGAWVVARLLGIISRPRGQSVVPA